MDLTARVLKLEQRFEHIYQTRMKDLPMVNTQLQVKALGFKSWNSGIIGVLITPWFINLVWLPNENKTASADSGNSCRSNICSSDGCSCNGYSCNSCSCNTCEGEAVYTDPVSGEQSCLIHLPAGTYKFVFHKDNDLGRYACCSLFSPVHEFATQADAELISESMSSLLWQYNDNSKETVTDQAEIASQKKRPAVSRRHLLRGVFLSGEQQTPSEDPVS